MVLLSQAFKCLDYSAYKIDYPQPLFMQFKKIMNNYERVFFFLTVDEKPVARFLQGLAYS